MRTALLAVWLLSIASAFAGGPALKCKIGPATKIFGGSPWLVYACDDKHSVLVIAAPRSAAAPFYFMFAYGAGGYRLRGEGAGNEAATDAAYKDLSQLKTPEVASLFNDAAIAPQAVR